MIASEVYDVIESALRIQKRNAGECVLKFNYSLDPRPCPGCGSMPVNFKPQCHVCSLVTPFDGAFFRETEHGYHVITLNNRKVVLDSFLIRYSATSR
jgi:hypothetical protein